ncbi:hypothetical protein MKO06_04510 [Gramella sp. GC03-9]|uniref:Uncharacterized protein n=1 Tax=Christiangramia oceanisediminis TaxID=2920386 RepID=A0A9X2IAM2_9FLAO|nr:hypothetical protein [Gramella oceanisediminis]MCP9199158.1 hypothetical protein [Gramella oceanisediminis]
MNKKFLILCLGAGMFFTSCQTDTISEDVISEEHSILKEKTSTQVDSKFHTGPDWIVGPGAELHEPDWITEPGANFHTGPDWIVDLAFFACGDEYDGKANLTVNKNNEAAYSSAESGEAVKLKNLNVGGKLDFCGLLSVENDVNLHRNAEFRLAGEMMIGTPEEPADLIINNGAHFDIAGKVYVTGNLIINHKGTLEIFGGEGEVMIVGGEIQLADVIHFVDHRDHDHDHEH